MDPSPVAFGYSVTDHCAGDLASNMTELSRDTSRDMHENSGRETPRTGALLTRLDVLSLTHV